MGKVCLAREQEQQELVVRGPGWVSVARGTDPGSSALAAHHDSSAHLGRRDVLPG